jgi:hypothetical protein
MRLAFSISSAMAMSTSSVTGRCFRSDRRMWELARRGKELEGEKV